MKTDRVRVLIRHTEIPRRAAGDGFGRFLKGDLKLGPIGHVALSTAIGVTVWKATGNPSAVPAALVTGVLIDGDHVLDWIDWIYQGYRKHMIVLLHAWELVVVLLASLMIWHHPIFVAAVLGYVGHVITDHLLNSTYPWTYFLSYRVYRRFRSEWLHKSVPPDPIVGPAPFWANFEPTVWKLVRWRRKRRILRDRKAAGIAVAEASRESAGD